MKIQRKLKRLPAPPGDRTLCGRGNQHVWRLNAYARALSTTKGVVPFFDPLDGGERAKLLLLLESQGPSNAKFRVVSQDNPSPTQQNLKRFLSCASIHRRDIVIWNTVPWRGQSPDGSVRTLRKADVSSGILELAHLLPLLEHLHVVLLAGRVAQQAAPMILSARPGIILKTELVH